MKKILMVAGAVAVVVYQGDSTKGNAAKRKAAKWNAIASKLQPH